MVTKNVNDKKEDVFMTILKSYLVEVKSYELGFPRYSFRTLAVKVGD